MEFRVPSDNYHNGMDLLQQLADAPYTDVLTIRGQNDQWRDIPLLDETLTVGRSSDNDVVLDDFAISRFHCRIQRESNSWFVVDLNSTNGILIDDAPATAEKPTLWKQKRPLVVGPYTLTWRRHEHETLNDATIILNLPGVSQREPKKLEHNVQINLRKAHHSVVSGAPALVEVELLNLGNQKETFRLTQEGLPEAWLALPLEIVLKPAELHVESLLINLAEVQAADAREYDFKLHLTAVDAPRVSATAEGVLDVKAQQRAEVAVHHSERSFGAVCDVKIKNGGPLADFFRLEAQAPFGMLRFTAREWQLALPPRMSDTVRVIIEVVRQPLLGRTQTVPYSIAINPRRGEALVHEGVIQVRPRFSYVAVAVSVLVLLVVAAAIIWGTAELRSMAAALLLLL